MVNFPWSGAAVTGSEHEPLTQDVEYMDPPPETYGSVDTSSSETSSILQGVSESAETSVLHHRRRHRKRLPKKWYIAYYVPSMVWIENYKWKYLPGDLCAGLNLASFQLPICLSYATSLAHVPAVSGCFGLIVSPFLYAIFGSVPQMVVGPEAAISLVVGHATLPYIPKEPQHAGSMAHHHHKHGSIDVPMMSPAQVAALLSGTVGALTLSAGLLRVGFLESVMSQSLLRGFVTGVGLVMIVDQLPTQLGLQALVHEEMDPKSSSFDRLLFVLSHWRLAHVASAVFAFTCLATLLGFRLLKSKLLQRGMKWAVLIPDIVLVVVVSTLVCAIGRFDERGVDIIGDVKPGRLHFQWPLRPLYWQDFKKNFATSFFIAILGFLETTVAARSLGNVDTASSANRELVALGSANLVGMMFGTLPSFGGYGRSKINVLSGARTQLSAMVVSLVTLLATYYLLGYLYFLPRAILSTIISTIGISLLEEAPKDIIFFLRVKGYSDVVTVALCLLATFFWSVEAGVAVGAFVAVMRVLHHATRPRIQILTRVPGTHKFVNADDMPDMPPATGDLDSGILVVKIPEPLTFANSGDLRNRLRRLELHGTAKVHPGRPRTKHEVLHHVIFQLNGMTQMDPSAASTLLEIFENYISRNIVVLVSELSPRRAVQERFSDAGLRQLVESQHCRRAIFDTLSQAVASFDDQSA